MDGMTINHILIMDGIILPGLLGIITHGRETYQPTSIMRWDRGIFNGSHGFISLSTLSTDLERR